ncbi:Alpha-N-acetylgalactosaminidase [Echinococcus granulosus]|nr:Alpha-N-acetylgalactosaminidase [Echinococcus granulosus]EUB57142.1 Alpha-N-acetylgalactosaminidase [Echinococcus granulosus]
MSQYEAHRKTLIPVAGPGHWNDLDMLLGGNFGLSLDETRVQMGMWAMHATPLILSVDLATMPPDHKEVLQAELVIRVNQDKLGKPADQLDPIAGIKIWKRSLTDFNGGWALAFLDLSDDAGFPQRIILNLKNTGISDEGLFKLTDAFTGTDFIITNATEPFEVHVNPSGIVMLIVQPFS